MSFAQVGGVTLWQVQVTQPHNIEIPRSLVEVVVSWNLPMHSWLKKYVFRQSKKLFGKFMNLTYLNTYICLILKLYCLPRYLM